MSDARDPLDMTLRELLAALLARSSVVPDPNRWLNTTSCIVPHRTLKAAHGRGEIALFSPRRGQYLIRASELDRWIQTQPLDRELPDPASGDDVAITEHATRLLEGYGYRRKA